MNYKRWFRVLVCLLVVCALVINISPIRAKAVAVDPVTAVSALGIILLVYMMMAGFVAIPATVETVNQLDRGFTKKMEDLLGDDDEKWAEFQAYSKQVNDQFFGGDDFPDPDYTSFYVGQTLAALISGWIAGGIKEGCVALLDAAKTDYAWYNDMYLPVVPAAPDEFSYVVVTSNTDFTTFTAWYCVDPCLVYVRSDGSTHLRSSNHDGAQYYTRSYSAGGSSWSELSSLSSLASGYNSFKSNVNIVWSNHDLVSQTDGTVVVLAASEPSDTYVTELPADAILGEVAQGIQNGTHTEDDLVLPATIDLSQVVSSPETALQEIQSTAQQLADGTITLDQFLEKVQVEESTEPDETTPSTSPEETIPSDQPVPDTSTINDYALDLTEFFPFCIPFDIYEFLSLLAAEPEAPVFEFPISVPQLGEVYEIKVDLSPWNDVAALVRKMELLAFIVGLAYVSREKFIRG